MNSLNGTRNGNGVHAAHASDLEEALARVSGVHGARVVVDSLGCITEVHVLATGERPAKAIVRDVTSTIQAGFGLAVDYRRVSVARLEAEAPAGDLLRPSRRTTGVRPAVVAVAASSRGRKTEVTVQVEHNGKTYKGLARGPASSALMLAAAAAVDAGSELLGEDAVDVRSAEIVKTNEGQLVAIVVLRALKDRGEESWSGSALVRKDPSDAIIRAAFSAMNRSLP